LGIVRKLAAVIITMVVLSACPQMYAQESTTGAAVTEQIEKPPQHFVLLVGVSEYRYLPRMKSPINNVKLMEESLRASKNIAEIVILTDGNATKTKIVEALTTYKTKLTDKDTLLIYYSGHGGQGSLHSLSQAYPSQSGGLFPNEDTFDETIMPVDATYQRNRQITSSELKNLLRTIPSTNITMVVDNCYDRASVAGVSPSFEPLKRTRRPWSTVRELNIYGYNVVMASEWNELAWEDIFAGRPYGVYTYFVAQGLKSHIADVDKDRRISALELFDYGRVHTLRYIGIQHPQIYKGKNVKMSVLEY
jgi:uncharacterized caspase-like protein